MEYGSVIMKRGDWSIYSSVECGSLLMQWSQYSRYIATCTYVYMLIRDAEERKEQARSNKQQGKATQHTQD